VLETKTKITIDQIFLLVEVLLNCWESILVPVKISDQMFKHVLINLTENCNFGETPGKRLCDCLVTGINDDCYSRTVATPLNYLFQLMPGAPLGAHPLIIL